jgi:hypothetical protein
MAKRFMAVADEQGIPYNMHVADPGHELVPGVTLEGPQGFAERARELLLRLEASKAAEA